MAKIRFGQLPPVRAVKAAGRGIARAGRFVRHKLRDKLGLRLDRTISGDIAMAALLLVMAFFMLLPLVFVVSNAFKPMDELFQFPPRFLVRNPTLDNFRDFQVVISNSWVPFSRYVFNSVFTTVVATAAHVILASMAAYVLEKHRFPGRKVFFSVVVLSLMFTPELLNVPNMITMTNLRMLDTYWAIILPVVGLPIGLFLIKQFMEGVPDSLLEAAKIDGASEWRIFWRIVMPMVKPAWLTAVIFCAQRVWNNTAGGNYIRSEQFKPLPQALNKILEGGIGRVGAASVVSLLLIAVPLLIFIFAQGNIIDTMASSGIKE